MSPGWPQGTCDITILDIIFNWIFWSFVANVIGIVDNDEKNCNSPREDIKFQYLFIFFRAVDEKRL